jgi:hypothetical protein
VSIPAPRPGLVICYSYLWATEYGKGIEEGRKNRPCAIIAARQIIEGREVVIVVPVTHPPPTNPDDAAESHWFPSPRSMTAGHQGQDGLSGRREFGPDLWPLPGTKPNRYDYGMLPPRFFTHIRDKILQSHLRRRLNRVQRSE